MADHNWTIDSIRPYVLTSIETMGVDRCFFATNWPVDWLFSTYDEVIDAYTEILSGFSRDEQTALFSKDRREAIPHLKAASWPSPVVPDLIQNPGVVGHAFSATTAPVNHTGPSHSHLLRKSMSALAMTTCPVWFGWTGSGQNVPGGRYFSCSWNTSWRFRNNVP